MKRKIKLCCCFLSLYDSDENKGEELKILSNKKEKKEYSKQQRLKKKFDCNTQSKIIEENKTIMKDNEIGNIQLLKNIENKHKLYKFWYEEEIKNNNKDLNNNKNIDDIVKPLSPILNILSKEIPPLSPLSQKFNISNEEISPLSSLSPKLNISDEEILPLSPLSQKSDEELSEILQVPRNSPQHSLSNSLDKLNNSLTINISPNFSYLPH